MGTRKTCLECLHKRFVVRIRARVNSARINGDLHRYCFGGRAQHRASTPAGIPSSPYHVHHVMHARTHTRIHADIYNRAQSRTHTYTRYSRQAIDVRRKSRTSSADNCQTACLTLCHRGGRFPGELFDNRLAI